jgi:16S rRNA (cytosine967-C5)-methyltransferase
LLRALAVLEWEAVPVECAPDALVLRTRVPPQSIFDQVCEPCAMQDAAAQLVAPLLASALGPGARVLDLCAAPGGKATHLAQLLDERSTVIAADARADRLADLTANLDRLRLHDRIARVVSDGRRPGLLGQAFDGVLVDAPCTGTGVLARRHDARWLRRPEDLVELPRLQVALLGRALDLVRPGGVVVYSTCSLEVEENDEVVDTVLGSREDVEEIGVGQDLPESMRRAGRMQTWPHRHGVDGAFAVRLRRRGGASPTRARGDVS